MNTKRNDSSQVPTSLWRQIRYGIAGTLLAQIAFSLCFWFISFGPELSEIVQWLIVQQVIVLIIVGSLAGFTVHRISSTVNPGWTSVLAATSTLIGLLLALLLVTPSETPRIFVLGLTQLVVSSVILVLSGLLARLRGKVG